MNRNKIPEYPNTKSFWKEDLRLLRSVAYNELTEAQEKVLKYLFFCLKWSNKVCTNNGQVDPSMKTMAKKLHITSQETMTAAIKKLVSVGFIKITKYGANKVTHKYMILVGEACKRDEQRWRQYPEKNWENEAPRRLKPFKNGEETWKENFKSKPKGLGYKKTKQPNGLGDNYAEV